MNFSRKKLHRLGIKVLTYLNAISLLLLMLGIDSVTGWVPYVVMILNLGWLYLVAFANGYIYDTKPYMERLRKERVQYEEMQDCD